MMIVSMTTTNKCRLGDDSTVKRKKVIDEMKKEDRPRMKISDGRERRH
jgi:hypothetical protein